MSFIECNCDKDGSKDVNCNDAGKCSCKTGFDGDTSDTYAIDFFIIYFYSYKKRFTVIAKALKRLSGWI